MTISPMAPGLSAIVPSSTDGGASADATADGGQGAPSGFLDALAAALGAPVAPIAATPTPAGNQAPEPNGPRVAQPVTLPPAVQSPLVTAAPLAPSGPSESGATASPQQMPATATSATGTTGTTGSQPGVATAAQLQAPTVPSLTQPASHPALSAVHPFERTETPAPTGTASAPALTDAASAVPAAATTGTQQDATLSDQRAGQDGATEPQPVVQAPGLQSSGVNAPQHTVQPTTSPDSTGQAITRQAFPEITKVVASKVGGPDGTHRITINLHPADLGEVRVTLVVRNGSVHVSLGSEAGSARVQQALSNGAPELRRMLELTGAADARVVIRETGTTSTATTAPSSTGSPGTAGHPLQQGSGQGMGHHSQQRWSGEGTAATWWPGNQPQRADPPAVHGEAPQPTRAGRLDRTV